MNAVIYTRTSTTSDPAAQTIEQASECLEWLVAEGYDPRKVHIISEYGTPGSGMEVLKAMIATRSVSTIVAHAWDRLSRIVPDLELLKQAASEAGITVKCLE